MRGGEATLQLSVPCVLLGIVLQKVKYVTNSSDAAPSGAPNDDDVHDDLCAVLMTRCQGPPSEATDGQNKQKRHPG